MTTRPLSKRLTKNHDDGQTEKKEKTAIREYGAERLSLHESDFTVRSDVLSKKEEEDDPRNPERAASKDGGRRKRR